MKNEIKIFYIVGDGRSGSTLLESILNNHENVISVGECMLFWDRFYKKETICGCNEKIESCSLWSKVDEGLRSRLTSYDIDKIKQNRRVVSSLSNFKSYKKSSEYLLPVIKEFYSLISQESGRTTIIDSSKSPSWGKLLTMIPDFVVYFIHLERSLPSVASSWKKKVVLPEYLPARDVFMPIKSNYVVLKTWFKVKLLSRGLKSGRYFFVAHEDICNRTDDTLEKLAAFLGVSCLQRGDLRYKGNHAIGGNPMRKVGIDRLTIQRVMNERPLSMGKAIYLLFKIIHKILNMLLH